MPVPSFVKLSAMVGFWFILQHTPLDVIGAPPSLVILPPLLAEVGVMLVISVVVKPGATDKVVNVDWLLYDVPTEFMA
jgi:hypothetical protein